MKEKALEALKNYPLYNYYENKANVFAMFLGFDARTGTLQKSLGTTYKPIVAIGKKRNFPMYMNHEECLRIAEVILKKIQEEAKWFEHATKEIYVRAAALIAFSRNLKNINYKTKSQAELLALYQEYCNLFKDMRVYSSIPMMLEHDTPILSNLLKEKLGQQIEGEMLNDAFSTLSSPTKNSYLLQEEIERLKIAAKYAEKQNVEQEIRMHTERWNWREYMFEGIPLIEADFLRQIEEDIEQHKDPTKRVEQIEEKQKKLQERQKEYIKKYALREQTQNFAEIAQDIVYLKYFRKGIFAESYYCVEFLLKEIGQQLNISLDDTRGMFDWEVEEALTQGITKEKIEEIRSREEFCAFVSYEGKCYPLTEEEATKILKENVEEENKNMITELKGQVACSGNVRGEVCIVNTVEDMEKMKEGIILTSVMTHPNLFSAMKGAGGIITDIGGLSCHAAIVARELQIPCIVGTKQASKILQDGMRVELDTSTGTIKIIN
ncbi:hypothetical protein HZC31_04010 [Candidatus Woesearchaeota archaeon]|nr:hypothetical protein [Candidatus Woesearchaeota archaeon]